jgi:AcrR family transcriptional regulator
VKEAAVNGATAAGPTGDRDAARYKRAPGTSRLAGEEIPDVHREDRAGGGAGGAGGTSELSSARTAGAAAEQGMRADARRNYQRLLTAAAAAFIEHGADDVSLEEIARRAGVGIGTLYRHFPSRQTLLEAVYRDQTEQLGAKAAELMQSEAPGEALADWMRALLAFGGTKRSLSAALLETLGKESELMSYCGTIMRESTSALLERAQRAGVARSDVKGTDVLRLAHGVIMATTGPPGDAGQGDRMMSLIIDGLLTEPQAARR